MFSTFTGSSRRPRNVNLSGQASNPFSNTSWSPAVASNATKTVSDAQADREKRLAERQRIKAASSIQKTWRGHRSRELLKEQRRREFDSIYHSSSKEATERICTSFRLLLSFYNTRCNDDVDRLFCYIRDCDHVNSPTWLTLVDGSSLRLQKFVTVLVCALDSATNLGNHQYPIPALMRMIDELLVRHPDSISLLIGQYFSTLAKLCQKSNDTSFARLLVHSIAIALSSAPPSDSISYKAFCFSFLTCSNLVLFEQHINIFAPALDVDKLSSAVLEEYADGCSTSLPKISLIWLLAHFVHIGRTHTDPVRHITYLNGLLTQVSALASEIALHVSSQTTAEHNQNTTMENSSTQTSHPYISSQLLSLVDQTGITNLLLHFSASLTQSTSDDVGGTGLLAGYIQALLLGFPGKADDTRMRLFLEEIPTGNGKTPVIKFLWQIMRQTPIFRKIRTEAEKPVDLLRRYVSNLPVDQTAKTEQHDWRIILLFLDLYTFILRLSDDEDFLSGICPPITTDIRPASRIRICSLSLRDVEELSTFLKHAAFALHYNIRELSQTQHAIDSTKESQFNSYWLSDQLTLRENIVASNANMNSTTITSTKPDLDSLRTIITATLKMLYERDSRKHFLPPDHWLMTGGLGHEDFIGAVIAEEERQMREETDDSDEEMDLGMESSFRESSVSSSITDQRLSRHIRIEMLRARQARAQRDRRLAEIGPKLEILKHIPFVVPFETRVMIFRQFIQLDRNRREKNSIHSNSLFARHHAEIRRGQIFEDAFSEFYQIGGGLKDSIQITFVDQFGTREAGIDGGGVTKEFLTSITSETFREDHSGLGMFASNEKGLLYPNPLATDILRYSLRQRGVSESDPQWRDEMNGLLKRFEFLGRIVGKCMYEGILVDLAFAGFFLLKWPSPGRKEENNYKGSVNDLQDMDEGLYRGLLRLKNYPDDVAALGLDFTIADQISPPGEPVQTIIRNLMPNGDQMNVTSDNRVFYIFYTARHRLVVQPGLQTAAFLRGLREIIRPSWLCMFNQSELQRLIGGDSTKIDIEDLRQNTVYSGIYEIGDDNKEHPTIQMFWNVMEKFTDAQRRDVLKYVTSSPRAPLLGFSQLKPKFSIRDGGRDEKRLPSTSTCVNLLKLPIYSEESTLRTKLLYAITAGAGFDLS